MESLRGEKSTTQMCRARNITDSLNYKWRDIFLEHGEKIFEDCIVRSADGIKLSSSFMSDGNGWESNPPRLATRPDTDFEDREAHRDLTTPTLKHNLCFANVNWLMCGNIIYFL